MGLLSTGRVRVVVPAAGAPRALLAVLVALMLVSCQGAAPVATSPSPAPTPTAEPELLTVILTSEMDTFDSHVTTKNSVRSTLVNVQEGLIASDPETAEPVPSLATSWATPDDKTWVFTLRTGVTFHNGEAFNAQAVKFNFDRVVRPGLKSSIGSSLGAAIERVEVVDPTTVRVRTKTPAPWLLERLRRFWFMPPLETAQRGDEYVASHPVGTGPYRFVEWQNGVSVTLERNDSYWGEKPAYRRVLLRPIIESATALSELLAGSADIVETIPADQAPAVTASGMADVHTARTQGVYEVALDALGRGGDTPFTDARVRRAANHAVDRAAIATNLFGGHARPVASFINPLVFGHDPALQPYAFDQAKARQLLAEAGYPDGFDTQLTIFPIASIDEKTLAEAIVSDLAEVGIRAQIKQISSIEASPLLRSGTIGPMWIRPNSCGGAFDAHLCFAFLTKEASIVSFTSDKLEDLRVRAGNAGDPQTRMRLYSEAQRHVHDEAAMVFGWTDFAVTAVSNKVDFVPAADQMTRVFLAKPK